MIMAPLRFTPAMQCTSTGVWLFSQRSRNAATPSKYFAMCT
nr:MAG: hypothetical protein [Molluscum contagiosum virus]